MRLAVDGALSVVAMDADGLVRGFRLATHLSVMRSEREERPVD